MTDLITFKEFAYLAGCDVTLLYGRKRTDKQFPAVKGYQKYGRTRQQMFDKKEVRRYLAAFPVTKNKTKQTTQAEFNDMAMAFVSRR
jgi:hypothetical protein